LTALIGKTGGGFTGVRGGKAFPVVAKNGLKQGRVAGVQLRTTKKKKQKTKKKKKTQTVRIGSGD